VYVNDERSARYEELLEKKKGGGKISEAR